MKAIELKKLGFKKTHVTIEESGDIEFDYYTLDIGNDYTKFCLISNTEEPYHISIFDFDSFIFKNIKDLKKLIYLLNKNLNNE